MDFPSGCFLWRGILQQFRYLGASGVSFFCRFCAGSCRVFSPSSRFFIRNLLHFADAACRVFSSHTGTFSLFFVFPAYGKSPAFLLPCGFFARIRRARIRTRVIKYGVACGRFFSFFRKTCRKTYLKHSVL